MFNIYKTITKQKQQRMTISKCNLKTVNGVGIYCLLSLQEPKLTLWVLQKISRAVADNSIDVSHPFRLYKTSWLRWVLLSKGRLKKSDFYQFWVWPAPESFWILDHFWVLTAPCTVLAQPDSHGNSRGAWGTLGEGGLGNIHEKF